MLLPFFFALREARVPVSTKEWLHLMQAMDQDLAGRRVEAFYHLSRAVLAKAVAHLPGLTVLLVTAPPQVLAARLAGRARETAADQARRLDRAGFALEVDRGQAAAYAPVRDAAEAALKAVPGMSRVSVILTAEAKPAAAPRTAMVLSA